MRPSSLKSGAAVVPRREPFGRRFWRWTRRFLYVSAALCCAVAGFFGTRAIHRFIHDTDYFQVEEIRIAGASEALEGDARGWLEARFKRDGDNLYELNRAALAAGLAGLPRARRAHVRKLFPHTLSVSFIERRPVMVANLDRPFLMDEEGVLLAELSAAEMREAALPVLTGVRGVEYRAGEQLEQQGIAEIIEAVTFLREGDETLRDRMIEWNLSEHEEITAIMRDGTEVRFGDRAPLDLLPKLAGALAMRPQLAEATYIDLRMERQLVYK